jgi:hypothetical protein
MIPGTKLMVWLLRIPGAADISSRLRQFSTYILHKPTFDISTDVFAPVEIFFSRNGGLRGGRPFCRHIFAGVRFIGDARRDAVAARDGNTAKPEEQT